MPLLSENIVASAEGVFPTREFVGAYIRAWFSIRGLYWSSDRRFATQRCNLTPVCNEFVIDRVYDLLITESDMSQSLLLHLAGSIGKSE